MLSKTSRVCERWLHTSLPTSGRQPRLLHRGSWVRHLTEVASVSPSIYQASSANACVRMHAICVKTQPGLAQSCRLGHLLQGCGSCPAC